MITMTNEEYEQIMTSHQIILSELRALKNEIKSQVVTPDKIAAMGNKELGEYYGKSPSTIWMWKKKGFLDNQNRLIKAGS